MKAYTTDALKATDKTCKDCGRRLLQVELAFNETLCDSCQQEHNQVAFKILREQLKKYPLRHLK